MVTGCNRGIGKSVIDVFANNGANIWACTRRQDDSFSEYLLALSNKTGVEIKPVYFDFSEKANADDMIFEYNNLSLKTIYDKAKNIPLIDGRGLENKVFINGKKVRFIDESYNASPATMKICINYFNEIKL